MHAHTHTHTQTIDRHAGHVFIQSLCRYPTAMHFDDADKGLPHSILSLSPPSLSLPHLSHPPKHTHTHTYTLYTRTHVCAHTHTHTMYMYIIMYILTYSYTYCIVTNLCAGWTVLSCRREAWLQLCGWTTRLSLSCPPTPSLTVQGQCSDVSNQTAESPSHVQHPSSCTTASWVVLTGMISSASITTSA